MTANVWLEVRRDDPRETRLVEGDAPALADGQVRFAIERFALTSNNVTYAVAGDLLGYWDFFPTDLPWGRVPAMGFATVAESRHPDVAVGRRVFGFLPMAREHVIDAELEGPAIRDVGAHRAHHAPVYRRFSAVPEGTEEVYALLNGLFLTSFLVDDELADTPALADARTVVLSASSKTAIALGWLRQRRGAPVVGLTSERNREFVEGLGCYDEVRTYDEIERLDASAPSVAVDMAGAGPVLSRLHAHLGDALRDSIVVGVTHWQEPRAGADTPGPRPRMFFAPGRIEQRDAEWGPGGTVRRVAEAWPAFADFAAGWLAIRHVQGPDALQTVWTALANGHVEPADGLIASLAP